MNELYLNKKSLTKLVNAHLTKKEEQKIRTVVVAKRNTFFDEELHLEANYSRKLKAIDAPVNVNLSETDLTKILFEELSKEAPGCSITGFSIVSLPFLDEFGFFKGVRFEVSDPNNCEEQVKHLVKPREKYFKKQD